jgi:hypothetical protein
LPASRVGRALARASVFAWRVCALLPELSAGDVLCGSRPAPHDNVATTGMKTTATKRHEGDMALHPLRHALCLQPVPGVLVTTNSLVPRRGS